MDLAQMRADWPDALRWLRYFHGWTSADMPEMDRAAIRIIERNGKAQRGSDPAEAAAAAQDLETFAAWVAQLAGEMRAWRAHVRAAEDEARAKGRALLAAQDLQARTGRRAA